MKALTDTEKEYLAQIISDHIHQLNYSLEIVRYPKQVGEEIQIYQDIAKKLDIEL